MNSDGLHPAPPLPAWKRARDVALIVLYGAAVFVAFRALERALPEPWSWFAPWGPFVVLVATWFALIARRRRTL